VLNERVVADEVKRLEADLREWGALPSKRSLPDKLIAGTFHESLDAYTDDIRTTAKRPGTDVLTPYGGCGWPRSPGSSGSTRTRRCTP
jgi:hypothetical protein